MLETPWAFLPSLQLLVETMQVLSKISHDSMSYTSQVLLRYLLRSLTVLHVSLASGLPVKFKEFHLVLVTSMWPLTCLTNPDIFSFISQNFIAPQISPTAVPPGYLLLGSAAKHPPIIAPVPCRVSLFQPSATRVLVLANSLASASDSPLSHWGRMRICCWKEADYSSC